MEMDIILKGIVKALETIPNVQLTGYNTAAAALSKDDIPAVRVIVYKDKSQVSRFIDYIFENNEQGEELKSILISEGFKAKLPQDFDTLVAKKLTTISYTTRDEDADKEINGE